jgi:hypothetical protein
MYNINVEPTPENAFFMFTSQPEFIMFKNIISCELPAHAGLGRLAFFGVASML